MIATTPNQLYFIDQNDSGWVSIERELEEKRKLTD